MNIEHYIATAMLVRGPWQDDNVVVETEPIRENCFPTDWVTTMSKNKRDKSKQRQQHQKRLNRQKMAGLPAAAQKDVKRFVQQATANDVFCIPASIGDVYETLDLPSGVKEKIERGIRLHEQTIHELVALGFYKSPASVLPGAYKIILLRLKGDVVGYLVTLTVSVTAARPAVIAQLTLKAERCYLANVQVNEDHRRRGLGMLAVSIIADCFPGVWWTAATEAGRGLSQSMVSKGLARSIGFDSPTGPMETECFEYIPRLEKWRMGESIWTDALPPARFHALLSRNRTK